VHVLESARADGRRGRRSGRHHATIERELAAHDERLARLPRVLALSKCDLLDERSVNAASRLQEASASARP